jgi:hypothetical protein
VDSIMEQLSKLQELSDDELGQLEESALSEFETVQGAELSTESVASMNKLADAVEAVRTEQARRVTAAAALKEAAAEAASRVNPAEAADTPMDNPDDEAPEGTTPDDSAPAVPVDDDENKDDMPAPVPSTTTASTEDAPAAEAAAETPAPAPETAPPAEAASAPAETPDEEKEKEDEEEKKKKDVPFSDDSAPSAEAATSEEATAEAAAETPKTAEAAAEQPAEAQASEAPAEEPEAAAATAEASNTSTEVQEDNVTAVATPQVTGELAIEPPAGRQPQVKPATMLSITAGADVPGYSAGTKLKDSSDVAEAFMKRLHTLRHVHGGDGEQHIVASYRQEFPGERELSANDPLGNTDKIQGVTSQEAITAAAGICLPLETRYELGCDVGVTDRPVRDALARFGADRGGIRYFSAPALADSAAATGFWRGDGSSPNSGTFHTYGPDRTTATTPADAKPCLEVQCSTESEAYIEAITLCLTFNNLTTRTFPELIKRHNELALVAHARVAENSLLARLETGSTAIATAPQVIGMARELFNVMAQAVAAYRHKHRMNSVAPLRVIAPVWVKDMVKADLAMQMPGDGLDDTLGLADAKIEAWFRSRGVNITWHLDGVGPGISDVDPGASGTQNGFTWPTTLEFAIFAEGTWLYLDGGTLDLGVIRDSSLVATNQYKQFVETFEGLANVGCDSYWVTAPLEPTGQAASLVDTLS